MLSQNVLISTIKESERKPQSIHWAMCIWFSLTSQNIGIGDISSHRCTGTFGLGGAVTILPEKKYTMPESMCCTKRTQIAVKPKTFTFLTSNERIIIPKLQLNPDFSNLQGKRKLVRKIGYFEKSEVTKMTVFD